VTSGLTATVPPAVLAAVLGAALLHATWNALVKAGGKGAMPADPLPATVLVVLGGAVVSALLLPFMTAPGRASWPFIAASSVTQCVYYLLLIEAYRSGDMSHAYPLMRGSAPLLVALVNGPLTGESLKPAQWLAMLLICGGVLAMALAGTPHGRGRGGGNKRRSTVFALLTACVIALYTLIDGAGVRRSGAPAAYTMWIFLLSGASVTAWAARGRVRELVAAARARPLLLPVGGVSTVGSYGIALWAMTLAPVAAIAALRETSILFATAIAALILHERVGRSRLLAVGLIACGAAVMRLA
jgi:drug/metabolite transporter (DMT)-like permease